MVPIDNHSATSSQSQQQQNSIYISYNTQPHAQSTQTDTTTLSEEDLWGDSLILPRPEKQVRICFQNIHGLTDDIEIQAAKLKILKDWQCNIFGLNELNLDLSQSERIYQPLLQRFKANWDRTKIICCSNRHESNDDSHYLPGGVMQGSIDATSARVREQFIDPTGMGRWIGQSFVTNVGS